MQGIFRSFLEAPLSAKLGLVTITAYLVVAIFAPIIAPYSETEILGGAYELWSEKYPLGTDNLGRDMLSRLIFGARNTIGIALAAVVIAFAIGGVTGMLVAILGGWYDTIISRIVDALMAIPGLVFALLILTILGTSIPTLVLVIAVLDSTRVYRITRASAMNVAVMDFVEVAHLRGEGLWWVIRKEILPNIMAPLLAEFGLRFCFVFLFIAALSFLGLGIQPPTADWGSMVRDNATLINYDDITPLLPAACIAVLTVAVNFVVDWLLHKSSGLRSD
ncbi:MAG TPA: ABC transporter permease [Gammaproteobacteria bacterium]|jgi:peptide/nickel transport system permease protein|nr:ABC transporter permease [Gammaproteobacteria bacterium]PHS10186.1 MAG: ABC transporter permease [Acidithiobacillus sp.]RTZ62819.1 MAG: ABC transporter permease [Gammaproteobacteria bacterium]HAD37498.1 ABC transporter permease [Gammaproteobacteria bacterium]HAN61355.1 ABC transporter permease [Gammaproteobacteria bacterium]|tara:strand:+ start:2920 stop:3750 length:831 start_codon:yes stop_codon:yes gene_type:complete